MKQETIELIGLCINNIEKAGLLKEAEAVRLLLSYSLRMVEIAREQNREGRLQSFFNQAFLDRSV